MKKKIIGGVLLTGLLGALVAGGTMAWFTDSIEVAAAEFTTGTVSVDAEGPKVVAMEDRYIDNVNPGDCVTVTWDIINDGTKSTELRVKLEQEWLEGLDDENVKFTPAPGSGWVTVTEEDGETWFYYTGGAVAGTYVPKNPDGTDGEVKIAEGVELPVVIGFDGELTGNEYQAQQYKIEGIVQAVQATNGAPAAVWGEAWNDVIDNGRNDAEDYFVTGPGKDMECIKGAGEGEVEPGETPAKKYQVTVEVNNKDMGEAVVLNTDKYEAGASVTVVATPNKNWLIGRFAFKSWTKDGIIMSTDKSYTFDMGEEDITLVANFKCW